MSVLRFVVVAWLVVVAPLSAQEATESTAVLSRPDPEGTPTPVTVTALFLDLVEVDDVKQEFTADVFVRIEWRDERLAIPEGAESDSERILPVSEVWSPQLGSANRRDIDPLLPDVVRIDPAGNVIRDQRFYGTLAARFELHEFPRDRQILPLEILSYRYTAEELDLDLKLLTNLDEMSLIGWKVGALEPELTPFGIKGGTRKMASGTFRLEAKREVSYYVWTMALPLLLIAIMAWTVFWIDPSLLPSQLAISTASVFSLIAFRFSIKLSLPRVSYLTVADQFILTVTILVFGALGHAVMTGRLAKSGKEDLAQAADRWGRWIYLAMLLGLVLWLMG